MDDATAAPPNTQADTAMEPIVLVVKGKEFRLTPAELKAAAADLPDSYVRRFITEYTRTNDFCDFVRRYRTDSPVIKTREEGVDQAAGHAVKSAIIGIRNIPQEDRKLPVDAPARQGLTRRKMLSASATGAGLMLMGDALVSGHQIAKREKDFPNKAARDWINSPEKMVNAAEFMAGDVAATVGGVALAVYTFDGEAMLSNESLQNPAYPPATDDPNRNAALDYLKGLNTALIPVFKTQLSELRKAETGPVQAGRA